MKPSPTRVLGIDPGYGRCGWAVVDGGAKPVFVASGCIDTPASDTFETRLLAIADDLDRVIREHSPKVLAVEKLFFTRNVSTAINVSQARGAIIVTAARHGLTLREYTPTDVKLATTGDGRAEKRQIAKMVPLLLAIPLRVRTDDEIDAIAVALCATASRLT